MTQYSVEVNHIGKLYRIGSGMRQYNTLRDSIAGVFRKKGKDETSIQGENTFWALKDVSFKVEEG